MTHCAARISVVVGVVVCAAAQLLRSAAADETVADAQSTNPYSRLSDQQWTEVVEGWERLDGAERRWFLTEVRKRKARSKRRPARDRQPPIEHRERARFGNIATTLEAERSDGQERPSPDDENRYGLGFEQRFFLRGAGPSRSPAEGSFLRGATARQRDAPSRASSMRGATARQRDAPSRASSMRGATARQRDAPSRTSSMRGASPSRTPAEGSSMRGATARQRDAPSRSPEQQPADPNRPIEALSNAP